MDKIFDSKEIYEFFQNSFGDEQPGFDKCKHLYTYIDETGLRVCPEYGL